MAARGQKLNFGKFSLKKLHFSASNGSCSSNFHKIGHGHTSWIGRVTRNKDSPIKRRVVLKSRGGSPIFVTWFKAKKNNMLPLRPHNFFFPILVPQHFFLIFTKIQEIPSGIPRNFWEFSKFLGNSQKSSEFPYFFKKKMPRHNFFIFRATVTYYYFFWPNGGGAPKFVTRVLKLNMLSQYKKCKFLLVSPKRHQGEGGWTHMSRDALKKCFISS